MACVKKRTNHGRVRWVADFYDQNGKRHMKFFDTRAEANAALDEIRVDVKEGHFIDPNTLPTFEVVARAWLETVRDRAPQSVQTWRSQIDLHLIPAFGEKRIDQITSQNVQTWKVGAWNRDGKLDTGLGRTTVNAMLQTLRRIFRYAIACEYIQRNPASTEAVQGLKKQRKADAPSAEAIDPSKVLTFEQAALLLEHAREGLIRTFIKVALHTGCRSSELLALRWSDLDLVERTLSVRRALAWEPGEKGVYGSSKPIFGPPKSDASYRTLELDDELVRDLKAWFMRSRFKADDDLVFPNETGAPLFRAWPAQGLNKALDEAGLPRIGSHGCRHTFASWLFLQGKPVTQVQHLMGHSNPDITLRLYSHWYKGESNRGAIEGLAAALRDAHSKQMVSGGRRNP
jgi:integrase